MEQVGAQNRYIEMTLLKLQIRQMRLRMAQILDHAIYKPTPTNLQFQSQT